MPLDLVIYSYLLALLHCSLVTSTVVNQQDKLFGSVLHISRGVACICVAIFLCLYYRQQKGRGHPTTPNLPHPALHAINAFAGATA